MRATTVRLRGAVQGSPLILINGRRTQPVTGGAAFPGYFDLNTMPNNDQWITVTTNVEDPVYFARHYVTTTDFKKLPNANGWNPSPCSAR